MAMNRNPYHVYGTCEGRRWPCSAPATSRCQFRREPEVRLCNRCADAWHEEVARKLAAEGIQPVGA